LFRFSDHGLLFLGEGVAIGLALFDWFGEDAGAFAGVERREHDTRAFAIEERHGETLMAAGLREGVETPDCTLVEAPAPELVERIRNLKEFLYVAID
jgi:hypothetical protein